MTKTPKDTPALQGVAQAIVDEVVLKQIAALAVTGANYTEIAAKLNLTRPFVRKACMSDEFKKIAERIGDDELIPMVAKAKAQMARLVDKAIGVVERHLDEGNLDAAKMVFKAVGLEQAEQQAQEGGLTIVMPGATIEDKPADIIIKE